MAGRFHALYFKLREHPEAATGGCLPANEVLSVFIVGSIVDVMFPHDADAFFKPDVFPPAAAEMVRKDVSGFGIFSMQERVHTSARRLDAPGKIVFDASPFLAHLQ